MLLLVNNYENHSDINELKKCLRSLYLQFEEIHFNDLRKESIQFVGIKGIILSGSLFKLTDDDIDVNNFKQLFKYNVPILGICFACQVLHTLYGGKLFDQGEYFCKSYSKLLFAFFKL